MLLLLHERKELYFIGKCGGFNFLGKLLNAIMMLYQNLNPKTLLLLAFFVAF